MAILSVARSYITGPTTLSPSPGAIVAGLSGANFDEGKKYFIMMWAAGKSNDATITFAPYFDTGYYSPMRGTLASAQSGLVGIATFPYYSQRLWTATKSGSGGVYLYAYYNALGGGPSPAAAAYQIGVMAIELDPYLKPYAGDYGWDYLSQTIGSYANVPGGYTVVGSVNPLAAPVDKYLIFACGGFYANTSGTIKGGMKLYDYSYGQDWATQERYAITGYNEELCFSGMWYGSWSGYRQIQMQAIGGGILDFRYGHIFMLRMNRFSAYNASVLHPNSTYNNSSDNTITGTDITSTSGSLILFGRVAARMGSPSSEQFSGSLVSDGSYYLQSPYGGISQLHTGSLNVSPSIPEAVMGGNIVSVSAGVKKWSYLMYRPSLPYDPDMIVTDAALAVLDREIPPIEISGFSGTGSFQSANPSMIFSAQAESHPTSGQSATASMTITASGTCDAVSDASATGIMEEFIAGESTATSDATATPSLTTRASGESAGVADASAIGSRDRRVDGEAYSTSPADANATGVWTISGTCPAVSDVSAIPDLTGEMIATVTVVSDASADPLRDRAAVGTSIAQSDVNGTLSSFTKIRGNITGISSATADPVRETPIQGLCEAVVIAEVTAGIVMPGEKQADADLTIAYGPLVL